jgi:hypothetical protein
MLALGPGGEMRNVLIAAAIGFTAVPASAGAADWYRVGHTNYSVIYTDAESVSREGEDLQVWEYAVMPTATESGMIGARTRLAIRCQDRSYRPVHTFLYRQNGTTNSVPNPDAPRQLAPPGSIAENTILLHCGQPHRGVRLTGVTPEEDARRQIR